MLINLALAVVVCALVYAFYRLSALEAEVQYLVGSQDWTEPPPIVLCDADTCPLPPPPSTLPTPSALMGVVPVALPAVGVPTAPAADDLEDLEVDLEDNEEPPPKEELKEEPEAKEEPAPKPRRRRKE